MVNSETDILRSAEKAQAELQKSPNTPVRARLRELNVEIRIVDRKQREQQLGDLLTSLGPWTGESAEELSLLLTKSRKEGGSADPPEI